MDESRAELSTYRDILEITDCVEKADVKKEKTDLPFSHAVVKKVADTKVFRYGVCKIARKFSQYGWSDECYRCHKKGHYAKSAQKAKPKDRKETFKARKVEEADFGY